MTSETLDKLSAEAEVLYYRLMLVADDFGRFEADPRVIAARCFPLRAGELQPARVRTLYRELLDAGAVISYEVGSRAFGYFAHWRELQRVRAKHSKYPDPPALAAVPEMSADPSRTSVDTRAHLPTDDNTPRHSSTYPETESESETKSKASFRYYTEEDREELARLTAQAAKKYARWWPQVHQLYRAWIRYGPPAEVAMRALRSLVEHDAKNPVAYLTKIIRVEEPNWHEARAIAEAERFKEQDAGGERGGGARSIGEIITEARIRGGSDGDTL